MITLRDDQQHCVGQLRLAYRNGARAPLFVAPCGFGKTVLFAYMTRSHVEKGGRVLILVHRGELLDQVCGTLSAFDVLHSVVAAGRERGNIYARVAVGSVQTAVRRELAPPSLIIVDEAHHCVNGTAYGQVLSRYAKAHRLGVTATPLRLSGEGLGESFDAIVEGPSSQQLIDSGNLSPFRIFCPPTAELVGVKRRAGDFNTAELAQAVDRPSITGSAVDHYARRAPGKQAVAFCVSIEHAQHVAAQFRDAGVSAQSLDGAMPSEWRRDVVRDFREGRLKILASCDLISEGFDVPGIECGIFLRPTMSLGLWLQQFGRCLRTAPGKTEAVILDHAGNTLRHGLPTDDRQWTLAGSKSRDSRAGGVPSVRICKACFAANRATMPRCVVCGNLFPVESRTVPQRQGELEEATPEQIAQARAHRQEQDAKSLAALVKLGKMKGYANPEGWARHVLAGRDAKKVKQQAAGAK